jgi:hypothetical protein
MGEGKRGRGDEVRLHVNDYEGSTLWVIKEVRCNL